MKNILTALLLSITILSFGQTTMNIYQNNGTTVNLPVSTIDSVNFTTTPPPSRMNIYQMGGGIISIVIGNIDSITYTVQGTSGLAVLSTSPVTNINSTSAVSGGNITNDGGTPVTQRGVVWSTSPSPTTANNSTTNGSGTGSFTSNLTNLTANTTYYVRAYATNSAGTAYGNELSFTTTVGGGGIVTNPGAGVTFDGYTYASIVLGNGQEWMAENLRTTVYANGDPIPNVPGANWNHPLSGQWCHYDNDSQYETPYGKLYNFYAVSDEYYTGGAPRNLCPTGWHVPSDAEWTLLIDYLGGDATSNPPVAGDPFVGIKMKSTGTQYWENLNLGTNESGFSGLPSGKRDTGDSFDGIGGVAYWWSSSAPANISGAWGRQIIGVNNYVYRLYHGKEKGLAVRCLKD
jgi:uncharacterized protein (TIGR02145 family)